MAARGEKKSLSPPFPGEKRQMLPPGLPPLGRGVKKFRPRGGGSLAPVPGAAPLRRRVFRPACAFPPLPFLRSSPNFAPSFALPAVRQGEFFCSGI